MHFAILGTVFNWILSETFFLFFSSYLVVYENVHSKPSLEYYKRFVIMFGDEREYYGFEHLNKNLKEIEKQTQHKFEMVGFCISSTHLLTAPNTLHHSIIKQFLVGGVLTKETLTVHDAG